MERESERVIMIVRDLQKFTNANVVVFPVIVTLLSTVLRDPVSLYKCIAMWRGTCPSVRDRFSLPR